MAAAEPGGTAADAALAPPHETPLVEAENDHPVDDRNCEHDRDCGFHGSHAGSIAPRGDRVHRNLAHCSFGFPAVRLAGPTKRLTGFLMR